MRKIFLLSLAALLSNSASAVTLEEALTSGYENYEELKSIRTDFLSEIEEFPRALSGFMPRIAAQFDTTSSKTKNNSDLAESKRPSSSRRNYSESISLTQPLFNGMKSVNYLKSAQLAFHSSKATYYSKEQDSFLKEIAAYLECVAAGDKYIISKVSVRSNKTQLEAMTEKFKLGESTETEVAIAREALATAESNQAGAYASFETSKANFYKIFGIDPTNIKMPEIPSYLPESLSSLINIAMEENLSIEATRYRTLSYKADANAAKGELLPKVDFTVQGTKNNYSTESRSSQLFDNTGVTTTLSVKVPILAKGGIEYSDIRRAKYKARKEAIALDSAIKETLAKCKGSWSEFEAAKMRIDATTQAVNAAEVAYEGMVQEEMLGSKTILDVLRAEEKLSRARESKVEARKELVIAAYKIKTLTGNLTAKSMNLKVQYFDPEAEFKKIKTKIIGF